MVRFGFLVSVSLFVCFIFMFGWSHVYTSTNTRHSILSSKNGRLQIHVFAAVHFTLCFIMCYGSWPKFYYAKFSVSGGTVCSISNVFHCNTVGYVHFQLTFFQRLWHCNPYDYTIYIFLYGNQIVTLSNWHNLIWASWVCNCTYAMRYEIHEP